MKEPGEVAKHLNIRLAGVPKDPKAKSAASKQKPKPKNAAPKGMVHIKGVNSDGFWRPCVDSESTSSFWKGQDVSVATEEFDDEQWESLIEGDKLDDNLRFLPALVHRPDLLNEDILRSITSLPSVATCSGIWMKLIWRPKFKDKPLAESFDQLPPTFMRCYIPEPLPDSPKFRCLVFATLILWTRTESPEFMSRHTCELQSKVAAEFEIKHDDKIVDYCMAMDDAVHDLMYGLYIKAFINQKHMQWLFDDTTLGVFRVIDPEGMVKWDAKRKQIETSNTGDLPEGFWEKVYFKAIKSWLSRTVSGKECSIGKCLHTKFLSRFKKDVKKREKA